MSWSPTSLIMAPAEMPRFRPETAALLIVDMQNYDAHPDYGMGRLAREKGQFEAFRSYFERVAQATAIIKELKRAVRASGGPTIYLRIAALTEHGRDRGRAHKIRGIFVPPGSADADIISELAPDADDIVISKTSASPFTSTNIDYVLGNLGLEHLLVAGVVTNGCVELTVRDAADHGYVCWVVDDACAAFVEADHRATLERMRGGLVQIARSSDAIAMLEAAAAPGRRPGSAP